MKKPITERISDLKARQDQLANRLTALQAKAKNQERKLDTRRKIIVGAAVIAAMEKDATLSATVRRILETAVTRQQDRDALASLFPTLRVRVPGNSSPATPPA